MSDIHPGVIEAWLREVPGDFGKVVEIEKFAGGQSNPTYRLVTTAGRHVLRRKPFGDLLPSAHAVDREYQLLSALHPSGLPVPRPLILCEDTSVIGSMFYIMELVEGRTFWDGLMPEVNRPERRSFYEAAIDALAMLHMLDHQALGLGNFGAPGNYFERQVRRWTEQYRASQTDMIPEVERLIGWLPQTVPEQTATSVIHGDYRIDNLIFKSGVAEVAAILDWELATIGDPLADLAYFAMHWILPRDGKAGLSGSDLAEHGVPTLSEITERYCRKTARDRLPDLHWYFAYNLFRLVGIGQGIKKRVADGNASSPEALLAIEKIQPLARLAWSEAVKAGAKSHGEGA